MIICKFTYSNDERTFDSIDEAIAELEDEEISCCDDGMLAENIFEVKCDLLEAKDSGDYEMVAEQDENGNWVFER